MTTFLKWFRAIDLNIFSVIFLLAFEINTIKNYNKKNKGYRYLLSATNFTIIQLLAEVFVQAILNSNLTYVDEIIFVINSYLYFSGYIISMYLILLSYIVVTGNDSKKLKGILHIPLIFTVILVIINFHKRILFRVPEGGTPVFEKYYYFGLYVSFIYIAIGLAIIFKNRKSMNKGEKAILTSFFVMPVIGLFLQVLLKKTFVVWAFVAGTIMMVYIFMQKKISQQDYLTNLWTRSTFDLYLDNHFDSKNKFKNFKNDITMIYLDLDEFKEINDIYGHSKGDKALQLFSKALKTSLNDNAIITRYGGDEFIVLYNNIPKLNVEQEIKNLKNEVSKLNKENKEKWQVKFSYSYGKYDPNTYGSPGQFIRYLDEEMYNQKLSKKLSKKEKK